MFHLTIRYHAKQNLHLDDTPTKVTSKKKMGKGKDKIKSKETISDDSDVYVMSDLTSVSEGSDHGEAMDIDDIAVTMPGLDEPQSHSKPAKRRKPPAGTIDPSIRSANGGSALAPPDVSPCGLCGQQHRAQACIMVKSSENLAEYRYMLIVHADDEPLEQRVCVHNVLWKRNDDLTI